MPLKVERERNGSTTGRVAGKQPVDEKVTGSRKKGCPYFALGADRDTSLLFPSPAGFCYRAQPAAPPNLVHQQAYCLQSEYVSCPVYARKRNARLPSELLEPEFDPRSGIRVFLQGVGLLLLVVLVIFGIGFGASWVVSQSTIEPVTQPVPTLAAAAVIPDEAPVRSENTLSISTTTTTLSTPTSIPAVVNTATSVPTKSASPSPVVPVTFTPPPSPTMVPSPTSIPSPTPMPIAVVEFDFVNLRSGPSTTYSVKQRLLEAGTQFDIVGQNANGDWWQICCVEEEPVWISAENVQTEGDTRGVLTVPPPMPRAVVLVNAINIRTGPGADYALLVQATLDAQYDVVSRLDDSTWWEVCCHEGDPGWVFNEGIEVVGSIEFVPVNSEIPPTATPEP